MLPQLDLATYPSQLFWLTISFLALYLVVSRVFMPAMSSKLAYRNKITDQLVQETLKLQTETKKLEAAAKSLVIEAYRLSDELNSKVLEELEIQKKQQQLQLAKELDELESQANTQLSQLLESLEANIGTLATEHANSIIRQFTDQVVDLHKMHHLVNNIGISVTK